MYMYTCRHVHVHVLTTINNLKSTASLRYITLGHSVGGLC